jgi:hypothetical protein
LVTLYKLARQTDKHYFNEAVTMLFIMNIGEHCAFRTGHMVAQLVEALRYKPEGRGFDS